MAQRPSQQDRTAMLEIPEVIEKIKVNKLIYESIVQSISGMNQNKFMPPLKVKHGLPPVLIMHIKVSNKSKRI